MAKTGRDSFKFMLRLPDDLRDQLKAASEASGRSVTAEIIDRLDRSFDTLGEHIADTALFRGIQIGIVETLFMDDDPLGALEELREKLRRSPYVLEIKHEAND